MRAIMYPEFGADPQLQEVPAPSLPDRGVVVNVKACGLCKSDWHGWRGHDSLIDPPHVPGHELAGIVARVGPHVEQWELGDRVTVPFVGGCGQCAHCKAGDPQVCPNQFQPGFSAWGAFAEQVAIDYADANLVEVPETIDPVAAATLGCRFGTAFRAVVDQGEVSAGEWVAVHGCGGVGLSAIMVATAVGASEHDPSVPVGPSCCWEFWGGWASSATNSMAQWSRGDGPFVHVYDEVRLPAAAYEEIDGVVGETWEAGSPDAVPAGGRTVAGTVDV